ncbi:MAG: tRNA (N(6)-L-threonylcarbamoyladenosine(37)-C(2))-methylthiotransferase MtaB, partial [Spirochaetota bacterium]
TLGCKLNQFETDSIATRFRAAGYEIVDFDEAADVYLVNSCTVTNRADRKSRNLLYRAQRRFTPDSRPLVVMTGCYVESHRDDLEDDESTWFVGNDRKQSIPDLVEAHFAGEAIHPTGSVFDFPVPERIFHTRATVKVQDGCNNYCTFCIIPYVRGRATSRPAQDVVAAAREALDDGAREIVLTGVNMSRYRDDEVDFATLIERVLAIEGDWRLRVSSLEPDRLTEHFIELFDHPRMAPHLHLCLQSASERILLAMRRQYTFDEYRRLARRLRERDPLFNLTTDIIVGFPAESDEEFEESLRAVESVGFGHVHTFPYSVRRGTRAERMPGHLPARVKTERAARIREAALVAKRRYRERLTGRTERVLVERAEQIEGTVRLFGLGEHYVPVETVGSPSEAGAQRYENTYIRVHLDRLGEGEDPVLKGRLA